MLFFCDIEKRNRHFNSLIGCLQGLLTNISWKYGLQMANTILCACNSLPSQASVTSTRSPRSYRFWNPEAMLSWKLFQHNANSSSMVHTFEYGIQQTQKKKKMLLNVFRTSPRVSQKSQNLSEVLIDSDCLFDIYIVLIKRDWSLWSFYCKKNCGALYFSLCMSRRVSNQ